MNNDTEVDTEHENGRLWANTNWTNLSAKQKRAYQNAMRLYYQERLNPTPQLADEHHPVIIDKDGE